MTAKLLTVLMLETIGIEIDQCAGLDALHAIKSYMDSLVTTYNQVNS
ncbi:hypothetical protein Lalb_Chr25g0282231 [Lupinus albus]|uniref:Uncharacterized protein n=1 Tax=Lupinus albus TaxID=3870 RepID=A0A6A4N2J8_LUPAL|nr:hypothetical protein Lalb_Chr25g0282231 [Lupinus albus]